MLAPWKKNYNQPRQHIKKQDITLPTKVHLVKAMVFPLVMYGCESWTIKESWALKNWCFWTVVLRFLRVPWTTRRSNHSILKETSPEYSLEGLMLKLKLQYLGHLMWRTNSLEKTLMLGKIEGRRRRGWQKMRWLDGITDAMNMNLGKLWEIMRNRETWCAAFHGITKNCTPQGDWQQQQWWDQIPGLWCSVFYMVQLSHPYVTTEKNIALTMQTFVDRVMSLLFNTLSWFVIALLPRSKHL